MNKITASLAFVLFTLLSCQQEQGQNSAAPEPATTVATSTAPNSLLPNNSKHSKPTNETEADYDQKLVKNAELRYETPIPSKEAQRLRLIAQKNGAYFAQDNSTLQNSQTKHTMLMRVPPQTFDAVISQIAEQVQKFDYQKSNVSDVSNEYYDTKARIKTKLALENRYIKLLDRATDIEEIMVVESKLETVRSAIERMQTRIVYLNKQVGQSNITIHFYSPKKEQVAVAIIETYTDKMNTAIGNGWHGLLTIVLALLNIWPLLLLSLIILFVIKRFQRQRQSLNSNH